MGCAFPSSPFRHFHSSLSSSDTNRSSHSAYYRSAADDERTFDWNRESFSHVRLRPRVLRDVTSADLSTTLLGCKTSMPVFISPAAMGRLAHPDGEKCLLRAAAAHDIPYIVRFSSFLRAGHDSRLIEPLLQVSANSSVSFEELAAMASPTQTLFYQVCLCLFSFT